MAAPVLGDFDYQSASRTVGASTASTMSTSDLGPWAAQVGGTDQTTQAGGTGRQTSNLGPTRIDFSSTTSGTDGLQTFGGSGSANLTTTFSLAASAPFTALVNWTAPIQYLKLAPGIQMSFGVGLSGPNGVVFNRTHMPFPPVTGQTTYSGILPPGTYTFTAGHSVSYQFTGTLAGTATSEMTAFLQIPTPSALGALVGAASIMLRRRR